MRLVDADLLESNLREKAHDIEVYLPSVASGYYKAADMVSEMPEVPIRVTTPEEIARAVARTLVEEGDE